jgi:hypothetical protein
VKRGLETFSRVIDVAVVRQDQSCVNAMIFRREPQLAIFHRRDGVVEHFRCLDNPAGLFACLGVEDEQSVQERILGNQSPYSTPCFDEALVCLPAPDRSEAGKQVGVAAPIRKIVPHDQRLKVGRVSGDHIVLAPQRR